MTQPMPEFAASFTVPGHDRDAALAILSQARLRSSPIDEIQVRHLLAIGWRAGDDAGYRRAVQALRDEAAWADFMLSRQDEDLYEEENLLAAEYLESLAAAPRNEGARDGG